MSPEVSITPAEKRKKHGFLRKIPGIFLLIILSVILLVCGVLGGIYSEWFQDVLRERIVSLLNNDPETKAHIGHFRLKFPLDLTASDILIVNHGDTMVQAGDVDVSVSLLPLFKGEVELKNARLEDARYQIGAMDSASRMIIIGKEVKVMKSTVKLSPLDINVSEVSLDGAAVDMWINPADTFPTPPPTEPSPLTIHVGKINFNNLAYTMQLMPTIYKLDTRIESGTVEDVDVDVFKQTVNVGNFAGKRLDVTYLMPDEKQIEETVVIVKEDTVPTAPWTVKLNRINMTASRALYTTFGLNPLPGLDFAYIAVDDIDLQVNDFYNQASTVILPFKVQGVERCGLGIDASGKLSIDSVGMTFDKFNLSTPTGTRLTADAYMGTLTPLTAPGTPLRLRLDGEISIRDVDTMFPIAKPLLMGLHKDAEIVADIDVNGTSDNLTIDNIDFKIDRHIRFAASGNVENAFDPRNIAGNVKFDMVITDISHWTTDLLNGTGVVIPSLALKGKAKVKGSDYIADFVAKTQNGALALDGAFYGRAEKYNIDLKTNEFPVSAFMPTLGIGRISGTVKADGQGFDFFKKTTHANADIHLAQIEYKDRTYSDISLLAKVADDHADISLDSYNSGLDLHLKAEGEIESDKYVWNITLDSKDIDLEKLGLSETEANASADVVLKADFSKNFKDIDATLKINSASYNTPDSRLAIDNSKVIFNTTDSLTNLIAQNRDMYAFYSTPLPLDSVLNRVNRVSQIIDSQVKDKKIDIKELQRGIMPFALDVEGGENNILGEMLAEKDISYERFSVNAGNDTSLYLDAKVYALKTGTVKLDTISVNIRQVGDRLNYIASVNNRPGTFDNFAHINVDGYFMPGKLGINLLQKDIKNKTGFELGASLSLNPDSTMTLHFEPYEPVINYRKWSLNRDNFITYDFKHKHIDANLNMKSAVSRLALYTEHATDTDKSHHGSDEDLILQLFDIQLQDWIALDPFAPPIKGNLSAGVRVNWEDKSLNGSGSVQLSDFYYGKEKVGDFDADITLFTDDEGRIKADAQLWVNGEKTISLGGTLNDDTTEDPFNLDFSMIHLPLSIANPFLTGTAQLSGSLNGQMDIKGSMSKPVLNGYLAFEDAKVNVTMLGTDFLLTQDTIPVADGDVLFKNFKIKGVNDNPLFVNGNVNISDISSPQINLSLSADNIQVINTDRARKGAEVYGKAFITLKAAAKGNLKFLNVNADASLLPGTNVTYVLAGGTAALENQSNNSMVKFVNFADTAAVAAADSLKIEGVILNLNANLNIQTGTILNVDLGTNAQDRVQLQGSGNFNYVSSPVGDGRLVGRYTFSGGFIKYAPPLISNINFGFTEGSYVSFNGNILNPQLNVKAVEKMRANVSQAGQNSRLIYFDIILSVTGSLENMNVAFDLETDDDVTVANELASMSPTQRASEAMNLLLYNTYTGGSTKATSNLNGNPLFSFLTNSVNSWLANNVRGVDLSIGVDQYDQTTNGISQTTTSYSYRVSKTLFNDRVKIIVGGSYSDDPNDDGNVAENLINDISVEYFLNNARTMYLKLFRHTGYESILEGEITQTGVGFVYRKRIGKIIDMFRPNRFKPKAVKKEEENEVEK